MPAESQVASGCRRRNPARISASRRERRRGVLAQRRDRHQAAQPRAARPRPPRPPGRQSAGSAPDRPARSGRVEADLEQHVDACGRARARPRSAAATSLRRSTDSTTSAYAATAAALLLCRPPTKCQRRSRSAHSAGLASASCCWFSPTSVTPSSASSRTSRGREHLGHDDQPDLVGLAAGVGAGRRDPLARPGPARPRSRRGGSSRRPAAGPAPACRPARRAVAAVGVEVGGLAGAPADVVDHDAARSSWARPRRRGRATACPTRSSAQAAGTTAATSSCIAAGHLVAAPAHVRADPGGRSRGAEVAHPRDGRGDDAGDQPGPAAVGRADDPRVRATSSTGTQSAARTIRTTPGRRR